tara:strand:+ start:870 stop:1919 length:1050 start_codon:yes stop_codon:yes gene_type:complete
MLPLPAILGLMGSSAATAGMLGTTMASMPFLASAMGSGIGSLLQGGSNKDALGAAALGGLGSFLGGKLGGGSQNALPGTSNALGATTPALNPDIAMKMGGAGTGLITPPTFMESLTRPEAIGAGVGGLAASSMMRKKPDEEEEKVYPRGMPIKNTSLFPEMGYDGGKEGEFDYNIAKNYAEGGDLQDPMAMEMGLGSMQSEGMGESSMNDKELISGAIDVIQGEVQDTDQQKVILGQFVAQFGQQALQDLVSKVQSGEINGEPKEGDGMVTGAGDGMADMIPASLGQDQDVLLSDGEFVVPADVVSGIGNGSSDSGSDKLYDMMDRVREMRTGGKTQPPAVPEEMMLPA